MVGRAGAAGGYIDALVLQGVQEHLGPHAADADAQDMGRRRPVRAAVEGKVRDLRQALHQTLLHGEELPAVPVQVPAEHLRGQGHAGDPGDVLGPGPHAALLAAPVQEGLQTDTVRHIEQARPLGAVDLVAACRQQVDLHPLGQDLRLAEALHGVHVEEGLRIGCLDGPADLRDRLYGADLIVGVHDRDQDGVGADRRSHLVRRDQAVPVDAQAGDLKAL